MRYGRGFSGKFVLRLDSDLHGRLYREAQATGLSLNQYCVRKLRGGLSSDRYAQLGMDREFLNSVVGALPARPLALILFGSFARGNYTASSDIDLLIVFDGDVRPTRSLYRDLESRLDLTRLSHPFSPHLVSLPERADDCGSLWFEVALEGVVLWEEGSRVSAFLREVRGAVSSGEIRRKTVYGHPYWLRKEPGL
jgi:predicted nucleotidyltransferase